MQRALHFEPVDIGVERSRNIQHQLFLQGGQFSHRALEPLGPDNLTLRGFDQLGGYPQQIAAAPDIAFQHIAHAKLTAHFLQIEHRSIAEPGGGRAGNHPQVHPL